MPVINKPTNLSLTWASAGDILDPGNTKYSTGWITEIPPRQWFNYLDNRQDEAIAHINQHGVPAWDAGTEYQENKSYVQGSTNGTIYRAKQTHTNQDPEADVGNVYWDIAFAAAGDFYTKTQADNLYTAKANNGSDFTNAATFRTNLSLYSQAQLYTKTEVDTKTTKSSQAQAEAGISDAVLMSPLRTEQWGNKHVLGMGQTWQNLTGSRAWNTTYTNSTGRPIQLCIAVTDSADANAWSFLVGATTVITGSNLAGGFHMINALVIPAGATYRLDKPLGTVHPISSWSELR